MGSIKPVDETLLNHMSRHRGLPLSRLATETNTICGHPFDELIEAERRLSSADGKRKPCYHIVLRLRYPSYMPWSCGTVICDSL